MHLPEGHIQYETVVCIAGPVEIRFCNNCQTFTYRGAEIADDQHLGSGVFFNYSYYEQDLARKLTLRNTVAIEGTEGSVETNHGEVWYCLSERYINQ